MNASSHAVIFDLDGVLVDSEVISAQVEAELFAELGAPIGVADIYDHFVGLSKQSMTEALRVDWGVELAESFWETRRARTAQRFATEGRPIAGIDGVLAALTVRSVPLAVASSSSAAGIDRKLSATGLDGFFDDHVYSAALVANGKPAPDLFWFTAERLGVAPQHCVVIEDSVHGVTAGSAAGMTVIGFTAGGHCGTDHGERLLGAGADHVATDAAGLSALLADRFR